MNLSRLAFLFLACAVLLTNSLHAQAPAQPWTLDKQFSADQTISNKGTPSVTAKMYVDNGKIRMDATANGMSVVAIMLPMEKKMYTIMVAQKMVMEKPMSDAQSQQTIASLGGGDAKSELVGPDTVDGAACTEYKVTTSSDPKPFFWWINTATKAPVKMTANDGNTTIVWKNYKVGPQDPSLFQPPAGYSITQMPADAVPGAVPPGGQ